MIRLSRNMYYQSFWMSPISYKTTSIYVYLAYVSINVGYIQCILLAVMSIRPNFSIETRVAT